MSDWGRVVRVPLSLEWERVEAREREFEREFLLLSDLEDDPVGQWVKMAKAKGEAKYSDELTLKLLVALHQKIDTLTKLLQNENREYSVLAFKGAIESIGHGVVVMQESVFKSQELYYARINLPVFPQRIVPLFLEGLEERVAKLVRIHDKDQKDWDTYIASRERAMIRESKGG
ncbi:hypothetical protein [Wolinella succinogenes]|uniref:hypothetical protein n=1 Tax=Wolinella succinogenes TaxID=844 RepID=UPI0024090C7C|nr:hypothetical protein [Wolinella succinogenes]